MSKERTIYTLSLDGGALCFHFINTVHAWRGPSQHDYFESYTDVLAWCERLKVLEEQPLQHLKAAAAAPVAAEEAVKELKQARALLYTFFSALAAGEVADLDKHVIQDFNNYLQQALAHTGFQAGSNEVVIIFDEKAPDLLQPLWLVMKSCYDVLTLEERQRIKECSECGWIFLDQTKNNKKRWCNPAFCGSTTKAKRYYQKKKQV